MLHACDPDSCGETGGGGGVQCPLQTFHRDIFETKREKQGKEKRENVEKWKNEKEGGKWKMEEKAPEFRPKTFFFFFFACHL